MIGHGSVGTGREAAAAPSLDDVLERIAARDVDPASVTDFAMEVLATRLKRRRVLFGTTAAVVLVASTTLALLSTRAHETEEVSTPPEAVTTSTEAPRNAKRAHTSTTTSTSVPATTAPIITMPAPTTTSSGPGVAPSLPVPAPPMVAPEPIPSAPPATAADRPGSATLEVASGAAGDLLELRFEFTDPDGPGGAPVVAVSTDEPGTPALVGSLAGPSGPCGSGPGSSATLHDRVQFASTGARTVSVAVKYCDGAPRVFNTTVSVTPPRFGKGQGRAVMAEMPDIGPALARGRWSFQADSGSPVALTPPGGTLSHDLGSRSGFSVRGVVLVLPPGTPGVVVFEGQGARYTGRVGAVADRGGAATRVPLSSDGSG